MPLESGTFVNSLVVTNPTGSDPKNQGDDHLRLVKSTVKNTFPNLDGEVSASQAEINILAGATVTTTELNFLSSATSNIQSQIDTLTNTKIGNSGADVSGTYTFQGPTIFTGTANATTKLSISGDFELSGDTVQISEGGTGQSTRINALEQGLGFYWGKINADGTARRLPSGWASTAPAGVQGTYRVTHNIGTSAYSVVVTAERTGIQTRILTTTDAEKNFFDYELRQYLTTGFSVIITEACFMLATD